MIGYQSTRTILTGMLLLGLALAAHAQSGNWIYLGESNIDGQSDHDNIRVDRDEGLFRAIQLRVSVADIDFDRVVVHFANDESHAVRLRNTIPEGGQARAIDLPGGRRAIRSVEIWYERVEASVRKPKVRLFGRR